MKWKWDSTLEIWCLESNTPRSAYYNPREKFVTIWYGIDDWYSYYTKLDSEAARADIIAFLKEEEK